MRRIWNIFFVLALLTLSASSAFAVTVTRVSSTNFWADSNKLTDLQYQYVAYSVLNNDGVNYDSLWVTVSGFTGSIGLAEKENGQYNLGAMPAGSSKVAFFYLKASSNTPGSSSHTVRVYNGLPSLNIQLTSSSFNLALNTELSANANKVTGVTTSPLNPTLGGVVTITATGETGTIGAAGTVDFSPAKDGTWDAAAFQVFETVITFSAPNPGTFTNVLSFQLTNSTANTPYTAVYKARVISTTTATTPVLPVASISSGTQVKYTGSYSGTISPVGVSTNGLILISDTVNCGGVAATATNLTYTLIVSNSAPNDAYIDAYIDTLSGSPTNASYVNNTSKTNNISYSNPTITGSQVLTWSGYFHIPANSSRNLSFQALIPAVFGSYTNSAYAKIGTNQLDTTLALSDNSPALCAYTISPLADLQITKTGPASVFAGTNLTYTLSLTNLGPSTSSNLTVVDQLPTNVTFVSASSGGFYTNGQVQWTNIVRFTNTQSTNFTVTVTAPSNSGTLTNVASVTAVTADPVSTNSNGSATNAIVLTTVLAQADLRSTKTGPTNVIAGTNFSYTITLTNLGPSTASSVNVTDTLPSAVTFVSATGNGVLTNGLVIWSLASFTNAASTNFTLTVTAPPTGTLTNIVSSGSADFDPVSTNNNGTATNAIVITTVTPSADLQTMKTGPTNVFAGTNFTYTITLTNSGPSSSSSVIVTDALPTGVTFVSATAGYTVTNGLVTWPISTFTNGATTNFTITVAAPASGTLTNRASAGGTTLDTVTTNNDGTASNSIVITTITPQADLKTTKTGPTNVFAGTNFSYTITLTNIGPSTATSLVVTDALPTGVSFVSASSGFTFTNGLVTWPVTTFTNGATTNFTVTVTAPASGTLTNRASVGGPIFDPVSTNNDGTASNSIVITTITPQADLMATKTGPTNVFAGTNFSYTIALTNMGPSTASSITVTDALPGGVTFVTASSGFTFTNGVVTWPIASFTNGASTNFSITVTAPASGTLTNRVSAGGATFDPFSTNNDGTAINAIVTTTIIPQADLLITKTGPTNVLAATNFSYTITLTNLGPSTASSVIVTDTLPGSVTFVSASTGYTFTNGIITWPITTFTNGAVTNFTVTVTSPSQSGSFTNVVSGGSSTFDPVNGNNDGSAATAKVATTVTPVADIQATKTGPTNVFAGTNFTYTISLTNSGPSISSNVTVTDTLPAGVSFVSASSGGISSSNTVVWQITSFTNTGATNFTVTVTAPANAATLTNIVASGSDTLDPVATNNNGSASTAIAITTVTPQADLATVKTGPANVFAATNYNYTISLTNFGPSIATGIIVTDALPSEVTFVSASSGGGFTNGVVTWSIASLGSGVATNFTITVTSPAEGTVTNRVSSGSSIFDPIPANNNGSATNAVVMTTVTPLADLQATKSGPATVFAATNFTYTISLTNFGPSAATSVVVTDALPAGVTFVSASTGYALTNSILTWSIANLEIGGGTNFTITVTAPPEGSLTNRISAGGTTIDPVPGNNNGTATNAIVTTTVTPVADLKITKAGPGSVFATSNFVYTISVTNIGPSAATSVVVSDALPTNVTFVSASGGYSMTNGVLTWPIANFANGQATNYSITVTAPTTGTLTNRAYGSSPTVDPDATNNDGSATNAIVTTTVIELADVRTTKIGPASMGAGTNIVYTISVTNAGPSTATGIVVSDALPTGTFFVSASDGGVNATNSVTWSGISLTNGGFTNLTVTIAATNGPITNVVSSSATTIDPDPSNNNGTSPSARVVTVVFTGVPVTGFVYNDANQNGFRDGSETGTGLTLYAKAIPVAQPTAATVTAIVDPTTGAYTLSNVIAGTYTIIIDDNNTLSDVTPALPAGWTGIEAPAQTRNNVIVALVPVPNQNFGLAHALTLKGIVFKDNGASGGNANDGIKNGGEMGIGSIIVKLTDSSGGTTFATTTTGGDGTYTLLIPTSVTNGMQVKVAEVNPTGYRSTGASLGNSSGTYDRTNDVVAFTYSASTAYAGIDFGDVPENEFTTDGQQAGLPGSTLIYSHTFTAGSGGAVTFTTTHVATPSIIGWSAVLYRDNNCNAQIDAGDTIITAPITLVADEKICVLVKEFIPTAAPMNAQDQVTIHASFNYVGATPALTADGTHVDLTTVGNPTTAGLSLLKEVDKATAAPGEVITYTITYINDSSLSLSNIVINDATPPFTTFFSATNSVIGAGLTPTSIDVPPVGQTGPVKWTFGGALNPSASGKVIYKVTIE